MRAQEEIEKNDMSFALHEAVEIDARLERQPALGDLALDRPLQRMMQAGGLFRRLRAASAAALALAG